MTKHLLDFHCVDELKNFAANDLFRLVIEVTYWDPRNWLVTYLEPCIERRDCHYRTSSIGYWGKGLLGHMCFLCYRTYVMILCNWLIL